MNLDSIPEILGSERNREPDSPERLQEIGVHAQSPDCR